MLTLNGTQLLLKNLCISVRQQLAGKDMSGQTSATDQAETDSKGKIFCLQRVAVRQRGLVEPDFYFG